MPLSPKERLAIQRQAVPAQDPVARAANFDEVNLGYSTALAQLEAERCLQCKNAKCITGCPVSVNIPRFIDFVAKGDLPGAANSLMADNCLPAVTGRVCPQESQCESQCVRAVKGTSVAIGALERFVADWAREHDADTAAKAPPSGKRVAVVGSGPGGLTAAGELARLGHDVTVFEAFHTAGGVLVYGIPEFRLPKAIVGKEVERLQALGVKLQLNAIVGRTFSVDELRRTHDAIFIAVGAGLPQFMNVPGENLKGVYSANEYLTRVNLMGAWNADSRTPVLKGGRVVVVGGGNVAMDAVRTAKRLGATEAIIAYRRGKEELPARLEEVHHAEEEGIRFELLVAPTRVEGNAEGWVTGLSCQRMRLGQPDASGRRKPEVIPGSDFTIACDLVVSAIGTRANPLLTQTCPELTLNKWGNVVVDQDLMSSIPGVFAGGDIVRGAATVILAMGDGKTAAKRIDAWLRRP
ncbi:MAG TPA: glutamate synthase (NADPH), homotetrameric [Planctomycetes bacterium]|nr:glutamate synthase (NADPH), homotetrameric [Planctomycetota bacterium]